MDMKNKLGKEPQISRHLFSALNLFGKAVDNLTEDVVRANKDKLRKVISFWRAYPDLMLDQIASPKEKFKFFIYQRIFLRMIMRHRYTYCTFPRAFSKSFLAVLCLYVRCMLYPNSKVFIVSGGKEQAAKIATEKLEEIWRFWPATKNAILTGPGLNTSKMQRDYVKIAFKNGSYLDIVAARETTRGGRRTSGLVEEAILVAGKILNEVIIPLMNVSRRAACGAADPDDITNKSQIYVTTAGERGTFAYDKLVEIAIWSVIRPWESMVLGGSWRTPVMEGLLDRDFAKKQQESSTYSPQSFNREYESIWIGTLDGSYFSGDEFDKARDLKNPMYTAPITLNKNQEIYISFDIGRYNNGDNSSLFVIETLKGKNGIVDKNIKYIDGYEGIHFLKQSIMLKKYFMQMKASKIIIDGNGVGAGLIDFLTVTNVDPDTGIEYPPFGIDPESDPKRNYKEYYDTKNEYSETIYLVKADESFNSEMYKKLNTQIAARRVHFLESGVLARTRLEKSKNFKDLPPIQQEEQIKPFVMTDILRAELINLQKKNEDSVNVSLRRIATTVRKDKVSALGMGIWYICEKELKNKKRRKKVDNIVLNMKQSNNFSRERGGFERNGFSKSRGA